MSISYFAYTGFKDIEESNNRVVEQVAPSLALMNSMALHYRSVRINLRTLGLTGLSRSEGNQSIKSTIESIEAFDKDSKIYSTLISSEAERVIHENFITEWEKFKQIGARAIALYQSGKVEDEEAMLKIFLIDCPEAAEQFNIPLQQMLELHKNNMTLFTQESKSISNGASSLIIKISIIGILLGLIISFIFAQNATKLSRVINEIAYNLRSSADEVASAANQIASSSVELSRATTDQASSLQETSSSVEEINSMISANTQSANQSAKYSENSLKTAERGKEVVAEMIDAIEAINGSNNQIMSQLDESNKEFENIVKLIAEIGTKTQVINDIVFQTKLLSFNASVEAARAGEHGKGFAVVAEEVGNLAAMSGGAAIEISQMLDNSINRVHEIASGQKEKVGRLIQAGKVNIDTGTKVAAECERVLEEVVKIAGSVSAAVSEIAVASKEQSIGVHEVTKAIAQLDQVTQENTSNASASANASTVLSEQANNLSVLVAQLVSTVEGEKKPQENSKPQAPASGKSNTKNKSVELKIVENSTPPASLPSADDSRFMDI